MEKYKKKLQEGADLRQQVRVSICAQYPRLDSILIPHLGLRETKCGPRRQERILGGRIPQSRSLQTPYGIIQDSNR